MHIRNLKQALNYVLVLKKVHKIIKFNQEARLKSYIDMNIELKKKAKNDFKKEFSRLMNNAVFVKSMKRDVKPVTIKAKRNFLASEPTVIHKIIFRSFISNKNEKNTDTYQ